MGFSADIDIAGGGAGSSLSVNGGKTDINADYKGVGEQSGIFTGDGGIDLTAGGKTTLIGGAITTTDAALQAGLNNYVSKGGITTQDIENTTSFKGDAISVGLSIGKTTGKPQAAMNGLGYGKDSDSDSSVTRAGITGVAGNKDITTDNRAEYAGALENSFDANQVNEELGAQTQITQEFGKEAPKAVAEFSGNRQTQLIFDGDLEGAEKWADGGAYRVALHTLVGAIATGSVDGALASGTTAVSIPAVGRYLDEQGIDETTTGALLLGLSAGVGATVGGDTAGAANSVNQTQNNYLNHSEHESLNELLAKKERMIQKAGSVYACAKSVECKAELMNLNDNIRKYERLDKARNTYFNLAYDNCRAGDGCKAFYDVHVVERSKWNAEAVDLFRKDSANGKLSTNWVKEDDSKNAFHNFSSDGKKILTNSDGTYRNTKYTHSNGQFEIIVDPKGNIVTRPSSAGTYNYYPNSNLVGHLDYDVDPWTDFGSGNGDNTTYESRRQGVLAKFPGEFGLLDDRDGSTKEFKELDKK